MIALAPSLPRRSQAAPVAVGITCLGVAFNLLRLGLRLDRGPVWLTVAAFLCLLLAGAALAFALRLTGSDLGLTLPRPATVLLGVPLAAGVLIGAAWLTQPSLHLPSWPELAGALAWFGLGTAPAEELLFRGVLYGHLERSLGPAPAVAVTALSFALAHVPVYGWSSFAVATAAGVVFGWLRWWSRSLYPAMAVHALADLAILWL